MYKISVTLIAFICFSVITSHGQAKNKHYQLLRDTFTVRGYIVLVAQKHFLSKKCDTYFGFVPDSTIKADTSFIALANKSKGNPILKNLSKEEKVYLYNKIEFAVLPWNENTTTLIYSNRDYLFVPDRLMQSVGNDALFLPSISSYGISKEESNICKPLYSITYPPEQVQVSDSWFP